MTPDALIFDYVSRLFGVGEWDELVTDQPYWEFRMKEIAKIKQRREKAGVTAAELTDAADYCKAHHIDIRNVAWLYQHLRDARTWRVERERALAEKDLDELLGRAIEIETRVPNSRWIERLIRARGPHRQEVLQQWQAQQPQTTARSKLGLEAV